MLFWYFLVIVALIWLIFATITDIKKREVPDWLNYSLITIGFGARIIYSLIMKDFSYILWGVIGFCIFFVFSNIMYYTKQWGGGDSKLLMGLGVVFGNFNGLDLFDTINRLPFLATLLINIFIAGTFYGIFYSLFLGLKNWEKVLIEIKNRKFVEIKIVSPLLLVLVVGSYFTFETNLFLLVLGFMIMMILAMCLLYLIKIVEAVSLYKFLEVKKLTEGDWLGADVVKGKKVLCSANSIGITNKDIILLKKNKIKKVFIKEGIPFVPGFLIGFIISIVFGDLIFFLW